MRLGCVLVAPGLPTKECLSRKNGWEDLDVEYIPHREKRKKRSKEFSLAVFPHLPTPLDLAVKEGRYTGHRSADIARLRLAKEERTYALFFV